MDERPSDKSLGVFGTIAFHLLLLLALIFISISSVEPGDEGILVALGDSQTGMGMVTPSSSAPEAQTSAPPASQPASTPPPAVSASTPAREKVLTQNTEEAPSISAEEKAKQEEQKRIAEQERRLKAEQERQRQEELERQRIADLERQKKEKEQQRQAEAAQKAGRGAFNNSGSSSQSAGDTGGSGVQGTLTGDPDATNWTGTGLGSGGSGFSLQGRNLIGSLPKPVYSVQESGRVVVNITVDKDGEVTSVEYTPQGSTATSTALIKAAVEAAKKARFSPDPNAAHYQKGTITYHFDLN